MQVDWITWSVFGIGLLMLLYWCVQTIREFRDLFQRRFQRMNQKRWPIARWMKFIHNQRYGSRFLSCVTEVSTFPNALFSGRCLGMESPRRLRVPCAGLASPDRLRP